MEEQEVMINTVLLGGIAGTATIVASGEKISFINPSLLTLVANVTKSTAQINRLVAGNPPTKVLGTLIPRTN